MTENLWLIIVAGGPLLIAILIAVALIQRRKVSPAEHAATERATKKLYDEKRPSEEP